MKPRAVAAFTLGVVLLASVTGCGSSSGGTGTATTTTAAKPPSAWVKQWSSKLGTDYGPAQEAFLTAIQSARVADVQAAAQKVKAANEALGLAIQAAGAPPKADQANASRLSTGLRNEASVITEILARCTGADPMCRDFVQLYGKNNRDEIIPALNALGANR